MAADDPLRVAERLFAAITAGDTETVRALYAADAVIWHNHDGQCQTRDENVRVLEWVTTRIRDLRYEEVRRHRTDDGFVQQHVLRGTTASGRPLAIAACIVCTIADGRITRLDEYFDAAQIAALLER